MGNTDPMPIPDWMIIDAVRYAVGRRSYQVSVTAAWLREHWEEIPEFARRIIQRDIEHEFAFADTLGDACDRREWERVRELWGGSPARPSALREISPEEVGPTLRRIFGGQGDGHG